MNTSLESVVLGLGALSFAFFGVWLLVAPRALAGVDLRADSANARTEVRAMYGGLELGIALFLVWCLKGSDRIAVGLVFQCLALFGLGVGRFIGIALEGFRVKPLLWFFVVVEFAAAALTLVAII